jgi:PilZ domain
MNAKNGNFVGRIVSHLRRHPRLELLESSGSTLTFKVLSGTVRCGERQVVVVMNDQALSSNLSIRGVKDDVCYGKWVDNTPAELALSEQVRVERRTNARLPCELRVVSSALPGGSSFTQNVGGDGLQLLMSGSVPPGTKFELALEADLGGLLPINLQAEVRWCRPAERGHLAGISLKESGPHRLDAFRNLGPRFARRKAERPYTLST